MNTENYLGEKIQVSDHFDEEKLEMLTDEYVTPYINEIQNVTDAEEQFINPRRMVGSYMTFLLKEGDRPYSVMVKKDTEKYGVQCNCTDYSLNEKCRHIAAALNGMLILMKAEAIKKQHKETELEQTRVKLELELEKNKILNQVSKKNYPLVDVVKKAEKKIDPQALNFPFVIPNAKDFSYYRLTSLMPDLRVASRRNKSFSKSTKSKEGVIITHTYLKGIEKISFIVNADNDIEVRCTCGKTYKDHACQHTLESVIYLNDTGNFTQFLQFTNQDKEKNALLADYGLTVADSESQEFRFSTDYAGRLNLSYAPPHFLSLTKINKIKGLLTSENKVRKLFKPKEENHTVGLYFQLSNHSNSNAPVKIDAYKSEPSKKGDEKITRIQINKDENLHMLNVVEENKYKILMDFSFMVYKDFVATGFYTQSYSTFSSQLNDTTTKLYLRYFFEKLEDHWHVLADWPKVKVLLDSDNFAKSNLKDVTLCKDKLHPKLRISTNEKFITLKSTFVDDEGNEIIGVNDDFRIFQGRIILSDDKLYLHNKLEINNLLETMPNGALNFPMAHKQHVIKEIIYPLSRLYDVDIPDSLSMAVIETEMIPCIHLKEFENKFLMISPKFLYDDLSIEMMDTRSFTIQDESGNDAMLIRQKDEEDAFVEYIRTLHPQFRLQTYSPYFTLPFEDVMKQQWFISFSQQLLADNIKVIGFSDLKRFKYNTSTPTWDMKVSSGIDWFDIKITATWGDQEMSFRDIRKAIINGQDFVVLGDGSFGMMPEEWIKKYSNLFKFGVDDKEGLKVSKKHFNIIDVLFDQIDDEAILAEIEEKKQKLLNIENINPQPIPSDIQATLRPYQEAGYQWMQVLDEISWGGCLADDMGLGKTLQAITFLSFLKKKYNQPTSLIVCPTSLIYNWENELKKFAPNLTYHLFYGVDREFSQDHFNDYDIIISSYGIVRNDIEALVKYQWEYIILDESQAIKNPDAISTKAVQLLKARNKFILSGTPLQNNTFDIYAQFNFLNPGLLGSKDFFRTQFANPIDKLGDKSASLFLRNLIKPFMLRRTKTEVAPDLPEKTEVILWCQMGKAQKAIYDEYKDYYRHALMQKIDTDGMAKAGVYILEGLLRLRQICDDPRLIKDKDIKPVKGIKIEELFRELDENMGDHKMLVFSQFTEMLALIREELDQKKISYCYLDGSTPAIQRQVQVDKFQNSKDINIFLISLKAGGVGLNLTEADYVYIVDPWWNPAVEQQAIDRTHRIGQKNKIFAYKMICKESVEEKIILLQEKKKGISQEIVQEDTAFFKSLTKDDISFLFS